MYQDIKVDDSCLKGKFIISAEDIKNLLPEEIKNDVEAIHVYVDNGQTKWIIFLEDDMGVYNYFPFSKELIYDPYGRQIRYGLIYLWRKARYLRDEYEHKGTEKKIWATYVCRPSHMFLLREVKEYWFDDGNGMGSCTKSKWFRAFP